MSTQPRPNYRPHPLYIGIRAGIGMMLQRAHPLPTVSAGTAVAGVSAVQRVKAWALKVWSR